MIIYPVQVSLSVGTCNAIRRGKDYGGGFQALVKKIRRNLNGCILTLDENLYRAICKYANGGIGGGYQRLFQRILDEIVFKEKEEDKDNDSNDLK